MEILVERESITVEQELFSKGKGGITLRTTSVLTAEEFKRLYPSCYRLLVIAELEGDDWWFGRRTPIKKIVLRQGLFSCGRDRYTKEFFCDALIEEQEELPDPPGNGMSRAICYTQEALDNYNSYVWPNGRKSCYASLAKDIDKTPFNWETFEK